MTPNLTPLDVRHQDFPAKVGGYDRLSVRTFLEQVAEQYEVLVRDRQKLLDKIQALEADIEERRRTEDDIRRAIVAAERIGQDLRDNATRESELMLAQAQSQRTTLERETEARAAELEATHQARTAALEAAFRARFSDLEREYHQRLHEREKQQADRLAELENDFHQRYSELTKRLTSVRGEYAQFVGQYRALVASFNELSTRHLPLEDNAPLIATPLPEHSNLVTLPAQTTINAEENHELLYDDEDSSETEVARRQFL